MGVGHWSWISRNGLTTTVVHVDDILRSYEDYRKEAEAEFGYYARANYADRLPSDGQATFQWAQEEGLEGVINTVIGDEFPYWNDDQGYRENEYAQRSEHLFGSIGDFVAESKLAGVTQHNLMRTPQFDRAAHVMACSEWAQLVVREWESFIYLAVGPSDMLNAAPELLIGTPESKFLAKCWAACDPKSTAFYLAAGKMPAPIELTAAEAATVAEWAQRRSVYHPNGDVLTAVVERARERAAECDDFSKNEQFFNEFGITPHELATRSSEIECMIALIEEYGGTPEMIVDAYERERGVLTGALMKSLALSGEKPYCADTAWTSKRVDISPYRKVAVVQLDNAGLMSMKAKLPLEAIRNAAPGSVSFMSESDFDANMEDVIVGPSMKKQFEMNDGMFTLVSPSAGGSSEGGILIFRGCLEWGHFTEYEKKVQHWLQEGGTADLEQLPSWMTLTTSGSEIRAVLDSLPIGASAAQFFDESGDLTVTGAVVEVLNGSYNTVYVTTEGRPERLFARYEPLVLNGLVVTVAALSNDREVTYD